MDDIMPVEIEGFSQVEYLTVFYTIIFGVIATEYFSGWGSMLRHRKKIKIYPIHLVWSLFAFLTLIQNWYGIWPRVKYINNNILYFIFGLLPLFLFYLMTVVLFPNLKFATEIDFKKHYYENSRILFLLFAIYLGVTISGSFVYKDAGDVFMQNVLRSGGIALALIGAIFNHQKYFHILFLTLMLGGLSAFMLVIPK